MIDPFTKGRIVGIPRAALRVSSFLLALALVAASVPSAALAGAVARGKLASDPIADPFWNSVVLLAGNDNNITGQTSFVDQSRYLHTLTANGNASTTSAFAPTGLTSSIAFDGTGDYLTLDSSSDFAFGTGDFTVEFWLRLNATGIQQNLYDSVPASTNGDYPTIYVASNNTLRFYTGTTDKITGGTLTTGQWYHIALARSGTNTKLFIDGTQSGSTYADSTNYLIGSSGRPFLGASSFTVGTSPTNGWMAGVRVTKGVARYTANFGPPALPLKVGTYEPIVATGGTITTVGNYKVHTFTSSGTFRVLRGTGHVWYLVVGGGGGGGSDVGGGGGGGGYRENGTYSYPVTVGSYAVTVGAGGAGGAGGGKSKGTSGSNSVFDTITALGGGGGGVYTNMAGLAGGSGGGAGGGGSGVGGSGTAGQGYAGGNGDGTLYSGAGGGAGGVGTNAQSGGGQARGGSGRTSSITGISVCRAGGGWGADDPGGTGQCGGAGRNGGAGDNGTANTGGGGGGGDGAEPGGGSGGSGVVIVRYPIGKPQTKIEAKDSPIVATGGTITTVTERGITRKIHTFTTPGTSSFTVTSGKGKVWYLVVGGGGGGGMGHSSQGRSAGGGGAGGFVTNGGYTHAILPGSYTVTVGSGGTGAVTEAANGTSGGNSSFANTTATGGGGGGGGLNSGLSGGSGGGGGGGGSSGSGTTGQGRNGGNGGSGSGGGGGGASAAGEDGGASLGGNGGNGLPSSISGTRVVYAGGGGGGFGIGVNGSGGSGGGGAGGSGGSNATAGTVNTGGGGGGGGNHAGAIGNGADGGSGIVVISYITNKEIVAKSPPALGLVGWWPFDKGSVSDKIYDRSGRGNHGYFIGGATSTANVLGKLGKAFQFDGTANYVSVPNLDYNTFTFSAWVKRDRVSVAGNSDRLLLSANSGGWGVAFNTSNTILFTKVGFSSVSSTGTIVDTTRWRHVVVTYDGGTARFYIDGVLDSSPAYSVTFSSGGGQYTIGSRAAAEFFQGKLDDVRIYNRALSAAEVAQLYNSQ